MPKKSVKKIETIIKGEQAMDYSPKADLPRSEALKNRWGYGAKILLYILTALIPLGLLPLDIGVEFSRDILFSFLVLAAFILWLLDILVTGQFSYKKSWISIGIAAFFAATILGTFFSSHFIFSAFISDVTAERFSTLLIGALIFFIAGGVFKKASQGASLLFTLIFSAGLAGVFSLLQFFSIWRFAFAPAIDFNAVGTVNALALFYSVLFLVLFSLLIFGEREGKSTFPWWFSAILYLILVIFLANLVVIHYRLAWLTLLVGAVFIFGFKLMRQRFNAMTGDSKTILIFVLLVISLIALFINSPLIKSVSFPVEISPSPRATLNIVRSVLQENTRTLLLGSGPATFGFDYSRFKDPAINLTPFWAIHFNQGFSYLSTILATQGIIGFLALLFLWGTVLRVLLKKVLAEERENFFAIAVGIGISALALDFIIYPANFSLILLFYILVGTVLVLLPTQERNIEFRTPSLVFISSLATLFLIALSIASGYFVEERLRGAITFRNGVAKLAQGNTAEALGLLERAATLDSQNDRYTRSLTQARLGEVQSTISRAAVVRDPALQTTFQNQVSAAISAGQQTVRLNGLDPLNWRTLGSTYETVIPFIQGSERFSFEAYQKAIELDPQNPSLWLDLGRSRLVYLDRLAFLINQKDQPKENLAALRDAQELMFKQAVESLSKATESKSDFSDAHFLLAQAYLRRGDLKEAINRVENAKRISPFDLGVAFQLGFLYYRNNQLDKAEGEFLRALSLNQDYSNARYFLGLIYDKRGEKGRALDQFERIVKFNPANSEVAKIMENIRRGRAALSGITSSLGENAGPTRKK